MKKKLRGLIMTALLTAAVSTVVLFCIPSKPPLVVALDIFILGWLTWMCICISFLIGIHIATLRLNPRSTVWEYVALYLGGFLSFYISAILIDVSILVLHTVTQISTIPTMTAVIEIPSACAIFVLVEWCIRKYELHIEV